MQVSIEQRDIAIERKVNISIPADRIEPEVDRRVREYGKECRLPGFRPGKVPFGILRKRFGPAITDKYLNETLPEYMQEAFDANGMEPAGFVSMDVIPYESGKDFEFSVTIELFPDIPNEVYEGLTVVLRQSEITDQDVQRTLHRIALQNAEFVEHDGEIGPGLRVTFRHRFVEDTDEGFASERTVITGMQEAATDLEKALQGARQGDRVEVEMDEAEIFYPGTSREDRKEKFLVQIEKVERPAQEVEVNDALAEKLNIQEGGLSQLKEDVRKQLESELSSRIESDNRIRIMNALMERKGGSGQVTVPRSLILKSAGTSIPWQMVDQVPEEFWDHEMTRELERAVLFQLVSHHIVKEYSIEPDDDQMREHLRSIAGSYEDPEEYINNVLANQRGHDQVRQNLTEKMVVDKILETASTTTESVPFQELVNALPDQ